MSAASPAHFFILGCSRSGTTMLASLLNAHPQIAIPPELGFLGSCQTLNLATIGNSPADRLGYRALIAHLSKRLASSPDISVRDFARSFARAHPRFSGDYADLLRLFAGKFCAFRKAKIFGCKTPANTTFMAELNRSFPDFRKIILLRDPRDVVSSYMRSFGVEGDKGLAKTLLTIKTYLHHLRKAQGDILTLRYEDLTADTERARARLFEFLGIDGAQEQSNISMNPITQAVGAHQNIAHTPFPNSSVYKATLTPAQIAIVETILQTEMHELGYMPEHAPDELKALAVPEVFKNFDRDFAQNVEREERKNSANWHRLSHPLSFQFRRLRALLADKLGVH